MEGQRRRPADDVAVADHKHSGLQSAKVECVREYNNLREVRDVWYIAVHLCGYGRSLASGVPRNVTATNKSEGQSGGHLYGSFEAAGDDRSEVR